MSATVHYLPTARPEPGDWAIDADGVLDAVEELLATGRTSDVIAFCELAVAFLEANAADIDDPTPLVRLGRRLGDLQRRAAVRSSRRHHPSLA
jgi:hypothetical protein